ncbi:MAG: hypothetical protein SFY56_03565 [Bacteroidota bacterium]|nr:hypothetical protein [Bacteroidota bacterium]
MKLSTIALGALMSFSVAAIAQQNPKTSPKTKNTKTAKTKHTKCVKPKADSLNTIGNSKHICYACGRG